MMCDELSDRMPAVAAGTARWTPGEVDHLATCADCRAEWAVVQAGALAVGDVTLDGEALAARVLHRLRTEPVIRTRRPLRWVMALAVAAAAVALVVVPFGSRPGPAASAAPAPFTVEVPGLEGLGNDELERVLESVEVPWTETSTADSPSLDDLNDQELARIARAWES
jgi:hypothetical protein